VLCRRTGSARPIAGQECRFGEGRAGRYALSSLSAIQDVRLAALDGEAQDGGALHGRAGETALPPVSGDQSARLTQA
jgi:hypothetical protein